jgi:hypothetical protein
VTTTSPLARLLAITDTIKTNRFNGQLEQYRDGYGTVEIGPAVSWHFGRLTESDGHYLYEDVLDDYKQLYIVCVGAANFIAKNSSPRAITGNLGLVEMLIKQFTALGVTSSSHSIYSFDINILQQLNVISNNLEGKETDTIIEQVDIESIEKSIDNLINLIRTSEMDNSIKDRILNTLGVFRIAIGRINLVGTDSILSQIDQILGQSIQIAVLAKSDDQKKGAFHIFEQVVKLSEGAQKLVESSQVVGPAAALALQYISQRLGLPIK